MAYDWLPDGWSTRSCALDPVALAADWWADPQLDLIWLEDVLTGTHLVGCHRRGETPHPSTLGDPRQARARAGWISYEGEPTFITLDRWAVISEGQTTLHSTGEPWRLDHRAPARLDPPATTPVPVTAADTDEHYLAKIEACQRRIRAGDVWVANLTTQFTGTTAIDAFGSHLRLRTLSPVPHAGLLRIGHTTLSAASPELFLSVHHRQATTSPIKGTRPRSRDPSHDAALRAELASSDKERAENLMIVDLCRNDLGRSCVPGSVQVPELFAVRSYQTVHQLVSTITGRLRQDVRVDEALASLFPAGSMTGAPKPRARHLLAELEGRPRGLYAGCFGLICAPTAEGDAGQAELAMTIRAVVSTPQGFSIGVGGGITALSDPSEELAEMHLKAEAMIASLVRPSPLNP